MSLAGSPVAVEDAAATLDQAGQDFADAADSIASHGRAITADWVGSAADAAFEALAALSARTRVGADVLGGVDPVLRVYAAELRAAQAQYDHAAATAARWVAAAHATGQDQDAAAAMPTGTLQQAAARDTAAEAANASAAHATAQVTSAEHTMCAAVARAERANQVAAHAVDALSNQLTAIAGPAAAPAPAPAPPAPVGHHDHHHGSFSNTVGGFGDGAWKLGPGAVGDLVGLVPTGATHGFRDWVESGHDALEHGYGADADSLAYRGTSTGTQVTGLFIPGADVVDGIQLSSRVGRSVRAARALGEGEQTETGALALTHTTRVSGGVEASSLFRADTRGPDEVFATGFTPKGSNMDLVQHVHMNPADSGYVSTTSSLVSARDFAWENDVDHVYRLRADGVDVNARLEEASPFPWENEVAVPGPIPSHHIEGAWGPDGWIDNPGFRR